MAAEGNPLMCNQNEKRLLHRVGVPINSALRDALDKTVVVASAVTNSGVLDTTFGAVYKICLQRRILWTNLAFIITCPA